MTIVFFILGMLAGIIITIIINCIKPHDGTLNIDHSNPEKDIYRFDVRDIDGLSKKKQIKMKVNNNANLSQK